MSAHRFMVLAVAFVHEKARLTALDERPSRRATNEKSEEGDIAVWNGGAVARAAERDDAAFAYAIEVMHAFTKAEDRYIDNGGST